MADDHSVAEGISALILDMDVDSCAPEAELLYRSRVSTYDEAGVLTNNAGLVVRLFDGTEFQITVVRSR